MNEKVFSLQVTLSHRNPPLTVPLPPGIQQASCVVAVQDDGTIRLQVSLSCRTNHFGSGSGSRTSEYFMLR